MKERLRDPLKEARENTTGETTTTSQFRSSVVPGAHPWLFRVVLVVCSL